MSFYWQNARPTEQNAPAAAYNQANGGAWDNINLGGGGQQAPHSFGYTQQAAQSSNSNFGTEQTYGSTYSAANPTFEAAQANNYANHQWAQYQQPRQQAKVVREYSGHASHESMPHPSIPETALAVAHMPILPPHPEPAYQNPREDTDQSVLEVPMQTPTPLPPSAPPSYVENISVEQREQSYAIPEKSQQEPRRVKEPVIEERVTAEMDRDLVNIPQQEDNEWGGGWEDEQGIGDETLDPVRSSSPPRSEALAGFQESSRSEGAVLSVGAFSAPLPLAECNQSPPDEQNTQKTPTPTASNAPLSEFPVSQHPRPTMDSWVEVGSSSSDVQPPQGEVQPRNEAGSGKEQPPPVPAKADSLNADSDSADSKRDTRSVRDRFKSVKEQYPELLSRISQYRLSGRSTGTITPTRMNANPLLEATSKAKVLSVAKSSTPTEMHGNGYPSPFRADISAIEGQSKFADYSAADMSLESRGYGEEIVDAHRRFRSSRNSRPPSRARSVLDESIGAAAGGGRKGYASEYERILHAQYGYNVAAVQHAMGRHSVIGDPFRGYPGQQYDRRSQSTFDQAAYNRLKRSAVPMTAYDAYAENDGSSGEEEEEESGEGAGRESDDEIRRIHRGGYARATMPAAPPPSSARYAPPPPSSTRYAPPTHGRQPLFGAEEAYYFGTVQLTLETVNSLVERMPPPREFWSLSPIMKAAYLFYSALNKKNYPIISSFSIRFNKEFYTHKCANYTDHQALYKICQSMQEAHKQKIQETQQRAYEASQRQLFSDDRDTPDSRGEELNDGEKREAIRSLKKAHSAARLQSDRGSLYEQNDASDAEDGSLENTTREPLFYRLPHALVVFGAGGRLVRVQPDESISVLELADVQTIARDSDSTQAIDMAHSFRGPLIASQTPPHSVRLYIQRQMERIRRCDLAKADPRNEDVLDALLIWQLLEMLVQQRGKVAGPDVARLLMSSVAMAGGRREKERGAAGAGSAASASLDMSIATPAPDPKAYERFTHFLLGGHINEAIDSAIRDSLFADALVLARRVAPHRVEEVESRLLATRPSSHPVLSLLAVASGSASAPLSGTASDERGAWRWHAAMLLANLCDTQHAPAAMESVLKLGEALSRKEQQAAADCCFLSVALLAGVDVFSPPAAVSSDARGAVPAGRRHIDLIHGSLPDDRVESALCSYGFDIADLHATEIFAYGIQLARVDSGSSPAEALSLGLQRRRLQYAKLLASWGSFTNDAFRYCYEVARALCFYNGPRMSVQELNQLEETADRVSQGDTSLMEGEGGVRSMLAYLRPLAPVAGPAPPQHQTRSVSQTPAAESVPAHEASRRQSVAQSVDTQPEYQQQQYSQQQQSFEYNHPQEQQEEEGGLYMQPVQPHEHSQQTPSTETLREGQVNSSSHSSSSPSNYHTPSSPLSDSSPTHSSQQPSASAAMNWGAGEDGHGRQEGGSSYALSDAPSAVSYQNAPVRQENPLLPSAPKPASTPSFPAQQHFHQQQQPQKQPPLETRPQREGQAAGPSPLDGKKKDAKTSGLGGWIKNKIIKISSTNEMILPDDSMKAIVYDPQLGRYVGAGVEEEVAPPPPPMAMPLAPTDGAAASSAPQTGGGLRTTRSGSSRYFNAMGGSSGSSAPSGVSSAPPPMPLPTTFSFIPTMPDDAPSESPFSEPTIEPSAEGGQAVPAQ